MLHVSRIENKPTDVNGHKPCSRLKYVVLIRNMIHVPENLRAVVA